VERDLVRAVEKVRGAAVSVVGRVPRRTARNAPARPLLMGGVGSGVIVSWRGLWVLSNVHVVDDEKQLEAVTADGRVYPLRVHAVNRRYDLAVLAFEEPPDLGKLRPASLAPRDTDARPGTWVLATGNPFFLALDGAAVATLGIVSGTRPGDASEYLDVPTLQHDAEINPGSSGGGLWSLDGELVGLNGIIATRRDVRAGGPAHTGASFAVPVSAARRLLEITIRPDGATRVAPAPEGATRAAGLGVSVRTTLDGSGRPAGALVVRADVGGPAGRGPTGLKAGDIITRLSVGGEGHAIRTASDLRDAMRGRPAGTPVLVVYARSGRTRAWSGRMAVP
jgi:serine protease Do